MLRKLIFAAAIAVLSAGSARAQVTGPLPNTGLDGDRFNWAAAYTHSRVPEQVGRELDIERNYREAVKKIPDKKPSNDPWKTVRPAATASAPDRHRPQ